MAGALNKLSHRPTLISGALRYLPLVNLCIRFLLIRNSLMLQICDRSLSHHLSPLKPRVYYFNTR
jgi:hypothetical protein